MLANIYNEYMKVKKWTFVIMLLTVIVFLGLTYRLTGISSNHSFWSDEAYLTSMARSIVQNERDVITSVKIQDYQPLQLLSITASMVIFGLSEWSARFPSVIWGTIGILFAYLLAAKLSTKEGGLLAAFIYAFSQLNLANATQAKQYAALQTLILIIFYLLTFLENPKKKSARYILYIHAAIIGLCTVSTLLHFLGVITWISYGVFVLLQHRRKIIQFATVKNIAIGIVVFFVLGALMKVNLMLKIFLGASLKETFFTHNHLTYFRELFWRNYGFITLPAVFGFFFALKKCKNVTISVAVYALILSYLWIFKHYTHNIRYVVPLFGILFVYFAIFWSTIGKNLFHGKVWVTCLIVAGLLFVGGNKFVRKPAAHYSQNADFATDIQNADYKVAYKYITDTFPNKSDYVIFNDTIDSQLFYLDGRAPDALFRKSYTAGLQDGDTSVLSVTKTPIYTTLNQFKILRKQYPRGLLIVEDWESMLPEDIKQYAKKNMKLEYRVENMEVAPTDKWPIEIYSWGME